MRKLFNFMKKLILFSLVSGATLLGTWTWFAKFSESYIYFDVPKPLYGIAEKWHGCKHQEPFSMPDSNTAVGVYFSVMIHKNQINPWGTIWRNTVIMRLIDGKWVYAGGGGSPKGGLL